jgi:hypothetical protein
MGNNFWEKNLHFASCTLKVGAAGLPETLLHIHQPLHSHMPEYLNIEKSL